MRSTRSWRCAPCTPHSGSTRPIPRRADVLIECSRCHAVFSLQDGIAAAGARFKVQCGRCLEVFETVAAPRTHPPPPPDAAQAETEDRKSTRLNSSHLGISYAVFCL